MTDWYWPGSKVSRVVDGDSLFAEVTKVTDIGFHMISTDTFRQKLRLDRINCPPIKTPEGQKALAFTIEKVAGQTLYIVTTGPYKYRDEWMAEITLPSGENLSDLLVKEGHASYWDGKGPRPGG